MSALRDAFSRRRQELNPLSTSMVQGQQPYPTPVSAVSGLSSPFGYHPAPYTPTSAVRQYNPQQWGPSAVGTDNAVRYSPRASEDIEAPAPPPYSPPRNNRPATVSSEESSQAHLMSPAAIHRPSPEAPSAPIFPPPPVAHSRALSRERPQPLFSLGAFARRPAAPDPSRVSPGTSRDNAILSMRPLQIPVDPLHQQAEPVVPVRPPASRRAASTGAIDTPSSHSRGSSTTRWEPGMPLPPPPPGPPPQSSSRSQSMTRTPEPMASAPRRPQAMLTLGPIPPTPAGWVDEDAALRGRSPNRGLQIDTSAAVATPPPEANTHSGSSSSGLSRAPAVRGEPRSIRERRSESRTGRLNTANIASPAAEESSNNPWAAAITPSDIMVPPMTVLGRRPTVTKSTPRSARSLQNTDTPNSTRTLGQNTPTLNALPSESRGSTPRPPSSSNRPEAPTPPFSPDHCQQSHHKNSPIIPPKSLPTPPPQTRRRGSSPRPVSHILHTPNNDDGIPPPLSPVRPTPVLPATHQFSPTTFSHGAIQRHNTFAQKEAAATTDEERVRLFAEFIVSESRLRREKYASAIDAMGSELLELTRDLFRPYSNARRESVNSFSSKRSSKEPDFRLERSMTQPIMQTDSPQTLGQGSSSGLPSPSPNHTDSAFHSNGGYRPSLSPIAGSMAPSDTLDESSSRGRPSSRWWEAGQSGAGSPTSKLERSKRESKYMGVPREARESLQWDTSNLPSSSEPTVAGPSSQSSYGVNEYPPEKNGWHDQGLVSPPTGKTPTSAAFRPYSPLLAATPNPKHLDVSRLVTLPPPYPRHHPAVNNNHPDLTAIRTVVRTLSDFTKAQATKERFLTSNNQMQEGATSAASQRRQTLRAKIQREIEAGTMTYADAAQLEAEFTATEAETLKANSKASFDLFQTSVVGPLNDLLMDRIHRATALFEELRSRLFVDAQQQSPNLPQEEGDEQPELLEKLTLLKWIFEAREGLHREVYDLLSDRNDRYRDLVTAPYRLAGNEAKVKNAEQFFATDARKRKLEYETEGLTRVVEFMDVVESNVVRGVEVQLNAFWDIAPSLRQILEKVPKDLSREFGIVIPRVEYDDNPGYVQWPLQYLYHLLEHGQKSTYQFIESQINLLCLLHEVKSVVAAARGRVEEAEGQEGQEDGVRDGMEREERRLTDDLKEKVRCVEELWSSAIGTEFESVKERVKLFLISEGGWEGVED